MNKIIEEPCEVAKQVSGKTPEGQMILSVLTKRTYRLDPKKGCVLSEEQIPLQEEPIEDEKHEGMLLEDSDLYPFKFFTDVVVKGHAYPPVASQGNGENGFEASVQVGKSEKRIRVFGERAFRKTNSGKTFFENTGEVTPVPLCFSEAYGGVDKYASQNDTEDLEILEEIFNEPHSIKEEEYTYPRNPFGKGYCMKWDEDQTPLNLPRLEDPNDLLTPENIEVSSSKHWAKMPMPWTTEWVGFGQFPRTAHVGLFWLEETSIESVPEYQRGLLDSKALSKSHVFQPEMHRYENGAALDLQFPYLKPGTWLGLENLHPDFAVIQLQLPRETPKIWVDGRNGKLKKTKPVIHTISIQPDENTLTILWRGSAVALRPYFDEELKTMPFKIKW